MTLRAHLLAIAFSIITLPMWSADSWSQEGRRPCLYRNVPAGCIPMLGLPKPTLGPAIDPDTSGIIPLSETPLGKAMTAPEEQSLPDFNKGTVTVTPVAPEEQGPPTAPT